MSGVTVKYRVKLQKERRTRSKGDTPPPVASRADSRRVSRAARMLALAHYVERLIEGGTIESYAGAARQLGVTRARITQLTNLLNLSPRVQESLLLGDLHLSERRSLRVSMSKEPSSSPFGPNTQTATIGKNGGSRLTRA